MDKADRLCGMEPVQLAGRVVVSKRMCSAGCTFHLKLKYNSWLACKPILHSSGMCAH